MFVLCSFLWWINFACWTCSATQINQQLKVGWQFLFFVACCCCRCAILWTWVSMVLQYTKISTTCSTKLCNYVTRRHYCCSKGALNQNFTEIIQPWVWWYCATAPCKILNFQVLFSYNQTNLLMDLTCQLTGTYTFSLGRCEIYPKSQRLSSSAAWTTTQSMHVPPPPVHTTLGHTCASVMRAALSYCIKRFS